MIPIAIGTRLGRYEIRSRLGAGGMGEVFLADDTQLGRRVALKFLPAGAAADEHARRRLLREARAAATLDHPHICSVYEVGEAEGLLFIAMRYVEGDTLAARLGRGSLELRETLAIAIQVVDALGEAHARGVLHRDLKPANVMLNSRGDAVVMDFGLAKPSAGTALTDETGTASVLTTPGAVVGTVPYMSPEQVRGEVLDLRSDLFSAGVLLYEMVSGRRPFDDSNSFATAAAILTREPLSPVTLVPGIPAELERIVLKLLRKNPEERYQTAKDLLIDLRALKDEQAFQVRLLRTPPTPRPGDGSQRERGAGAGIGNRGELRRSRIAPAACRDRGSRRCWPRPPADGSHGEAPRFAVPGRNCRRSSAWRRRSSTSRPMIARSRLSTGCQAMPRWPG